MPSYCVEKVTVEHYWIDAGHPTDAKRAVETGFVQMNPVKGGSTCHVIGPNEHVRMVTINGDGNTRETTVELTNKTEWVIQDSSQRSNHGTGIWGKIVGRFETPEKARAACDELDNQPGESFGQFQVVEMARGSYLKDCPLGHS